MSSASTLFVSLVLNSGVSREELARAARMPIEHLGVPTMIDYDAGMRLWQAAERLTGDPYVGLRCGARFGVDQLGALGAAFAHSPTLRDALTGLSRLLPLVIHGAAVHMGSGGEFQYRSPSSERHGVDAMFAAILRASRDCTQRALCPEAVRFQATSPPDDGPYRELFGVLPTWGEEEGALRFAARDLDAPMRGADPVMSTLLADRASALLAPSADDTLVDGVKRAVLAALSSGDVSLEAVAKRLGAATRTLQRELAARGRQFAQLRDEVRRVRAEELLADPSSTVEDVALQLGFATRTAFARAYRRWTGRSPRTR